MPDLTPKCSAAAPPLPAAAIGPYQPPPPFPWEDRAVFRETFLFYFTEPGMADDIRDLGSLLYDLVLAYYDNWPDWQETPTRAELRAGVADLFQLQGFLASVWQESEASSPLPEDLPLCRAALGWSRRVAELAREIETVLGPLPEVGG